MCHVVHGPLSCGEHWCLEKPCCSACRISGRELRMGMQGATKHWMAERKERVAGDGRHDKLGRSQEAPWRGGRGREAGVWRDREQSRERVRERQGDEAQGCSEERAQEGGGTTRQACEDARKRRKVGEEGPRCFRKGSCEEGLREEGYGPLLRHLEVHRTCWDPASVRVAMNVRLDARLVPCRAGGPGQGTGAGSLRVDYGHMVVLDDFFGEAERAELLADLTAPAWDHRQVGSLLASAAFA